ncbi:hypothetical protein BJX61DRAFT_549511 [Aspergillus egyptiacus]|nr:hypothetical protein BJX61DRAFT_549511 [Aspergillus egyptiacus]
MINLALSPPPNKPPAPFLRPDSENYTAHAVDAYWDVRAALSPACIFLPASTAEVATAMKIIGSCDAQFAIRGGGHMNVIGSNNIDAGVLLALNNLNQITVHSATQTVEVGPGVTWYEVYRALEPTGQVVIGGRLKSIGVAGLSLIGGFHYFNNRYGFAMDNVLGYEVVLGNGTVVTAGSGSGRSQEEWEKGQRDNLDLFWALKGGGGNNFGVVTRFVLRTFAVPVVSTTVQTFEEGAVPAFLAAVCELAKVDDREAEEGILAAGIVATVTYNTTTRSASATLLGVQEGESRPPSRFGNFSLIAAETQDAVTTMARFVSGLETPKQMFRIVFAHHTIKADTEALVAIYEAWRESLDAIADVQGLMPIFVPNIVSPSAVRVARSNGVGNVWGLEEEALILWQFSTSWTLARDSLRVETWSRRLAERLHAINREKGLAREFVYMGDAGDWQDPFAGFPAENVARMRAVQAEYDPGRIFSRLNWGGFKLSG